MDMASARERFAENLQAVKPEVSFEGKVNLVAMKHPVLVMRGIKPVANDVELDMEQPALVISGPNAGGKTVALKSVGLAALLVQHGCWVPCAEGSRMDLFTQIFASIGDQQTVEEDLSSFSSHLKTLNLMLEQSQENTLLLLDEIASGTDPAQGAVLAQAILEQLLDQDPRVVVTTHYSQLKALATVDPRFAVAAMQYVDGAPTYKILPGVTGESHAFSIAKKMGILDTVLTRAEDLMGEAAKVTKTLEALEEERSRAQVAAEEAERAQDELERKLKMLEEREEQIKTRSKELEKQGAQMFLSKLKEAEADIGQVVKGLQQNPSFKDVDAARELLDQVRNSVDLEDDMSAEPLDMKDVAVGDTVLLTDIGSEGTVASTPNKKGELQVSVGGLNLRTNVDRCELVAKSGSKPAATKKSNRPPSAMSKAGKKGGASGGNNKMAKKELAKAVRTPGNTLDLRGFRAEDVGSEVDYFLDKMTRASIPTAFILTGHGTGVIKKVSLPDRHSQAQDNLRMMPCSHPHISYLADLDLSSQRSTAGDKGVSSNLPVCCCSCPCNIRTRWRCLDCCCNQVILSVHKRMFLFTIKQLLCLPFK